ncbi:manganese peroxidase [Clathrus columnatus]|uniref:Peroxidase n=1 Tax=Clathrus columnatus TaxID=1419009 RepID=A0AAV5AHB2_9AGAM|nr:manganese peroxidase [Clathrus columnatus]
MVSKALLALSSLVAVATAAPPRLVTCPDGNKASNAACCPLFALRDDLQSQLFTNECSEDVHEVVRLTFHDAIAFSESLKLEGKPAGGGADGSMLVFPNVEPNFSANLGISDSVDALLPFLAAHPQVSAGDLIQFAGAVGISNCPGAPQLEFLLGRPNATAPAPDGLIPEPQNDVTSILSRMADGGGFTPDELIALLSSHSIARSDHVDPTIQAVPFDSTPFTFDTQIFVEVLLKGTGFPGLSNNTGEVASPLPKGDGVNVGEMRLQSDFALARDPRTACTWQGFVNEQEKMSNAFKQAMKKLAVVGQDTTNFIDCSEVVPTPVPALKTPAFFPATKTRADVQQACFASPFPNLKAQPGASQTIIPHCIATDTACLAAESDGDDDS